MTNSVKSEKIVDGLCFSDYVPYWEKLKIESIRKGTREVYGRANPNYRHSRQNSGTCVCSIFRIWIFGLFREKKMMKKKKKTKEELLTEWPFQHWWGQIGRMTLRNLGFSQAETAFGAQYNYRMQVSIQPVKRYAQGHRLAYRYL